MIAREVKTTSEAYRAAVAEIAPRARLGSGLHGVHVVDGHGKWWERLGDATGAVGFVIDEPAPAPPAAHALMSELDVPVVVMRRRVRFDVVADAVDAMTGPAGSPPSHVVVDAWGGRTEAAPLLRDAAAWGRVLAGGSLRCVSRAETPRGTTLALAAASGVGVSVTRAVGGGVGGVLAAVALGANRLEVRIDSAAPLPEVSRDDGRGRRLSPPRRESAERLALRRLLDALAAGERLTDLDELRADDEATGLSG